MILFKKFLRTVLVGGLLAGVSTGASATLLGVVPGLPVLNYDNTGTLNYNAGLQLLSLDADPISILFPPSADVDAPEGVSINITVDNVGNLVGGFPGDDLVVTGVVQPPGPALSGVLLTGEIIGFGFMDSGGPIDLYDFQFVVTGGLLAQSYAGSDIGVTTTSNGSTFTGDFTVDFGGGATGDIGPVQPGLPSPVPEPTTLLLMGLGLAGLGFARRRMLDS